MFDSTYRQGYSAERKERNTESNTFGGYDLSVTLSSALCLPHFVFRTLLSIPETLALHSTKDATKESTKCRRQCAEDKVGKRCGHQLPLSFPNRFCDTQF